MTVDPLQAATPVFLGLRLSHIINSHYLHNTFKGKMWYTYSKYFLFDLFSFEKGFLYSCPGTYS